MIACVCIRTMIYHVAFQVCLWQAISLLFDMNFGSLNRLSAQPISFNKGVLCAKRSSGLVDVSLDDEHEAPACHCNIVCFVMPQVDAYTPKYLYDRD